MSKRRASNKNRQRGETEKKGAIPFWAVSLVAILTFLTTACLASRVHLVMGYATLAEPQVFEPLLASNGSLLVALVLAGAWLVFFQRTNRTSSRMATRALWFQVAAQLPLGMAICRVLAIPMFGASIWEPIWMSVAMGLSCSQMAAVSHDSSSPARLEKLFKLGTLLLPALAAIWWYAQTVWFYSNFHLGFNDFGHFGQRVANTAAGRGFLLETPVLPAFWDHFNPGLVLLVPLWWIFQSVHLFFAIQAICLACSAWLIYAIARSRNAPPIACFVWLCAWLAHPALGQMNLAYTYGWHPITLAIPALLFSILMLIQRKYVFAFAFAILAMSFEEGVIVVLGCFAAACAIGSTGIYDKVIPFRRSQLYESNQQQVTREAGSGLFFGLSTLTWIALCLSAIVTFVLVYRFSGLADFQTGRFVALGNSAGEVLLAPILRPTAFWGAIFRPEKLAYLLCLLLPCFAVSLVRGKHILATVALPLGVLIVWDHLPASCLAFQYASTLLPFLWLATIVGTRDDLEATSASVGALVTGAVLSIFVGQLPYSSPTIVDVLGRSYGMENQMSRAPSSAEGQWLNQRIQEVVQDKSPVLATGRIAAHLVGNADVETVGQYLQRRDQLAELDDRKDMPIRHYRWILLDSTENFQQSPNETSQVEAEALEASFIVIAEATSLRLLRRKD